MKRTLRPRAALTVVALIGMISAGCGSKAPSGDGAGTSSGTGGTRTVAERDKAVEFAECMRDNGLRDFPDPDANGEFVYGVGSPAAFERAVGACKDLQPPGTLSARRSPEQQTASLGFARCMREHGVKDFPDPANGEPLVDTTKIPSTARDGGMSILNAAMQQCRGAMDEAAAGR